MTMAPPPDTPLAMTLAVVICTYRRPDTLLNCLGGLTMQTKLPDDLILVMRPGDHLTHDALRARPADALPIRIVAVERSGLVAARNAGLAACASDIAAFCDDDTVAGPNWVAGILAHFEADPTLGGLGGRDRCHDGEKFDDRRRDVVGRLQWFGRPVGNHHLGHGGPRDAHFLKGANMAFRMEALRGQRFDERLRGRGAQPHDDLSISLSVCRSGWRLIYDPTVSLDHYAAQRDQPRSYVASAQLEDPEGYADACFNQALALSEHLSGFRLVAYRIWSVLVGVAIYPGFLQALRRTPAEGLIAWRKFLICQRSGLAAIAASRGRPSPPPPGPLRPRRAA